MALTDRSKPPCRPSWETMWSKNGSPVVTSTWPGPSSAQRRRRSASPWCALRVARGGPVVQPGTVMPAPLPTQKEAVVFRRGPHRGAQAPVQAGPAAAVAHQHRTSPGLARLRPAAALRPPQDEVGLRRPHLDRHAGKLAHQPFALARPERATRFPSRPESQGQRPAACFRASRWYGRATRSRIFTTSDGPIT